MKYKFSAAIAVLLFSVFPNAVIAQTASQSACPVCNIVEDGVFYRRSDIVGHYVYFRSEKGFVKVDVIDVDYVTGRVRWAANNQSGWDDARNYYTETAVNINNKNLEYAKNVQRNGLAGACAIAEAAKRDDNMLLYMVMINACCNSSAAKTYGVADSPMCK